MYLITSPNTTELNLTNKMYLYLNTSIQANID